MQIEVAEKDADDDDDGDEENLIKTPTCKANKNV